jgi:hypothetical protein
MLQLANRPEGRGFSTLSEGPVDQHAGPSDLSSQDNIDPRQNQFQLSLRKLTYPLEEESPVQSHHLRDIGNRIFRQPGNPGGQRDVAGGASAHRRLLVNGTQTTVAIRLWFKASPCTTAMGLLNPGPDPQEQVNRPTKSHLARLPLASLWNAG